VKTISAETTGAACALVGVGNGGTHFNGIREGKTIFTCYDDTQSFNPHTEAAVEGPLGSCTLTTP
jgi:hypothetical protein